MKSYATYATAYALLQPIDLMQNSDALEDQNNYYAIAKSQTAPNANSIKPYKEQFIGSASKRTGTYSRLRILYPVFEQLYILLPILSVIESLFNP